MPHGILKEGQEMTTTQQQLDDLTYTIGESLREAWLSGYNSAGGDVSRQIVEELEKRKDYAGEHTKLGLDVAIAIIKEMEL
jgi:hypothetical protein